MDWLRNNSLSTVKNHNNTVSQKEDDNPSETKLEVMEGCDVADREFKIVVIKNSMSCKTTQKGSSVSSGIKLMSRRNIYKRGRNSKKKR